MSFFTRLQVLLLIVTILPSPCLSVAEFECEDEWELIGTHCYRFVDVRLNYEDSVQACEIYGADLLYIRDEIETATLASTADDMFEDASEFWIANIRDPLCRGYWQPYEPNDDIEGETAVASNMDGRWRLASASDRMPFVCRTPACPEGFFRCNNGKCLHTNWVCDDEYDCDDQSDENDCGDCVEYLTGNTGSIDTDDSYPNKTVCQWIIEGDPGEVLKLEFEVFDIEPDVDVLTIYVGGPTLQTSIFLEEMTGTFPQDSKTVYSSNNFFILRLTTDGTDSYQGIKATWSPVTQLKLGEVTMLEASNMYQVLTSPFYEDENVPMFITKEWMITDASGDVISVEVVHSTLDENDMVVFSKQGVIFETPDENTTLIVSQTNNLTIILDARHEENIRFKARFKTGCSIDSSFLQSSLSVVDMPADLNCVWNISNPKSLSFSISFKNYSFDDSDDFIKVFGSTQLGENERLHLSMNSTEDEVLDVGSYMIIQYFSNALRPNNKFRAMIASECPDFPDTDFMERTGTVRAGQSYTLNISCETGYEFMQEEYNRDGFVIADCSAQGDWYFGSESYTRYPSCQIVYCGIPDQIQNGIIIGTSGNVTYHGTAEYDCFNGFTLQGSATITCQADGSWTEPPSCEAEPCDSVPDVDNANYTFVTGSASLSFGTIVHYSCDPGFDIIGAQQIVCGSNGTWSHEAPECTRLSCSVPHVENGNFSYDSMLPYFEDEVLFTCDWGYRIDGTDLQSAQTVCGPERTLLNESLSCVDRNECDNDPCDSSEVCVNNPGSFVCLCKSGYSGSPCEKTLDPYDHCGLFCGSSFCCTCQDGYELFAENGTNGFYIPPVETGLRDLDVYHINVTCVPKQCNMPPATNTEGEPFLITAKTIHHYEDELHYFCDFGYALPPANNSAICNSMGIFEGEMTDLNCSRLMCLQPPDGNELELSRSPESGTIPPEGTVNITCLRGDGTNNTVVKRLFCAPTIGNPEEFSLQGDNPECRKIDCQMPEESPGSIYIFHDASTEFGTSFEFTCDSSKGFSLSGFSSDGTQNVSCLASGRWGFGNLTCLGAQCTDPGFNAGTRYSAPNGFSIDELVYYECVNPTYTLVPSGPRICEFENGNATWNGSVPICVDQMPPEIYCTQPPEFNLYDELIIEEVTAEDNSGFVMVYQSDGPLNSSLVTEDVILEFLSTDGTYETGCSISIYLTDLAPPTLFCEPGYVEINQSDFVTLDQIVTGSSDFGLIQLSHYDPIDDRPGSAVGVRASMTKSNGLMRECATLVQVTYPPCTNESIANPNNGTISNCREEGGFYKCDIQCNDGFLLPDFNVSYTGQCQEGIWNPSPDFFNCHEMHPTVQLIQITEVFAAAAVFVFPEPAAPVEECIASHLEKITTLIEGLTGVCGSATFTVKNIEGAEHLFAWVIVDMTIRITGLSPDELPACRETLTGTTGLLDPTDEPAVESAECRVPWTIDEDHAERRSEIRPEECDINGVVLTIDNSTHCAPCGPGYKFNGVSCQVCEPGTFNPLPGRTECQACPYNGGISPTRGSNAISEEDCEEICPPGFTSSTGYVADGCFPCPEDMYWENALTCSYCENSGSTKGIEGAIDNSYCQDPCEAGTYSLSGYEECISCPINFYSNTSGSTRCTQCPSDTYTDSEGSTSLSDCLNGSALCTDDFCSSQGAINCSVIDHKARCLCRSGYSGDQCDNFHNPCDVSPCYNSATCIPDGLSYSCDCPKLRNCTFIENNTLAESPTQTVQPQATLADCQMACEALDACLGLIYVSFGEGGICALQTELTFGPADSASLDYIKSCDDTPLFAGDHCEEDLINDCKESSCSNKDFCKDLVDDTECICPPGAYQAPRCEPSADPCEDSPCANGAVCEAYESVRRICFCRPGFTGENCSVNMDDCGHNSEACLYGGECVDGEDAYSCDCPEGFGGENCEEKGDLCESATCGEDGTCISDYHLMRALCFCGDHYKLEENSTDSCVPINYCDSSPCEHNATCEDFIGGYSCDCLPGYEGFHCQQSVDDCATSPCENGGVCHDKLNDFECVCPPGFEGKMCETNIDDCTGQCVLANIVRCENLVLDFKCICREGFKGKDCNETILLCDDEPCRHGGVCTDLIDSFDFSCACPDGWTGKTCEEIDDYCMANTCQNQAQCYNLVDRTYCDCEEGTAGINCETKADVCGLFSPFACLHGECSDDDSLPICTCLGAITSCEFEDTQRIIYETGSEFVLENISPASLDDCEDACDNNSTCVAFVYSTAISFCQLRRKYELDVEDTAGVQRIKICQYDPHYSGKSCQLQKDQCHNTTCGLGENIGQCIIDGFGFKCDCEDVKNFEGQQCKTPVEVCHPSACPAVTTCHQYMDSDGYLQPVCLCGADEILSGDVCKSVYRNVDLAFPPGLPRNTRVTTQQGFYMGNEMEITITFWVACLETPDDWVLSIARPDQDPESAEYNPFIEIHNQEIIFTETENISLPERLDKDFQWHFIKISIDQNRQYILQYDFLTPRPDGRQLSIPFPVEEYLVIHLGQSLIGYISQVSVWKSVLTAEEGVRMAGDKFHVPQPSNLALGWTLYTLNVLVQQVYPSSARQKLSVCTIDGTLAREETCPSFVFPDKMPPTLLPETPCRLEQTILLEDGEHQETINRLGYRFSDGITSSNIIGDVFTHGAHDIAIISVDNNGNIVVCMTRTYVTPNTCEDTRPSEEFEDCDGYNNTVSVECPDNEFPSTPQPKSLTCGKLRSYNLEDMFKRPPRIICGACLDITFSVTLRIVYTLPIECPRDSIEELSNEVKTLIEAISAEEWNALCVDIACSNVNVSAECSDTAAEEVDVTIVIKQLPDTLNSTDSNQSPLTPRELMLKLLEDEDALDASEVLTAQLKEDDFSVDDRPLCLPGHVISGDCCVQCGAGSFHDAIDDVCKLCPVNYFTNSSGQTECMPCPGNNATLQEGSNSIDDCVVKCNPGEYLNLTTGMCDLCPSNFYQDLSGQIICKPCPPATGTESTGSTDESECQDYCPPGSQLNDAQCVSCQRGHYRRGDIQDQCRPCPENTTTADVGSSGIDQCVIPICDPGSYVYENPINTYTCLTCDYGFYQNETSMFQCEECMPMYTTASTGAIDESECVFVCPPGEEEDPDNPFTCRSCERGTYRGPSLGERFIPCQNCSGPFITDQIGSRYANQCIVAECLPGSYLNVSDNSCYACDYGSYQAFKWQTNCSLCDSSFTTEYMASDSSSDCLFVCPEGYFESSPGSETCEICSRGTYRGSTLGERFLPCSNCSDTLTTAGPGATRMSHCNITVCNAGSYRNATDNLCRPCPKGQYQDEDLQLSCKSCNDNYTTNGTGKASSTDCIFVCPEGSEVVGFETCELCGRGLYKNDSMEFDMCEPCSWGWTTDYPGAISSEQCNIKYCLAGDTLSDDFSVCIPCHVDSYQPINEPDSRTTCTNCSANTGTEDVGSDDPTDCITTCQPGFGYNSTIDDCSVCLQGFFNNGNLTMRFLECEQCPTGFTTVVEEGATHESNCSLRDCPPGSYFNRSDVCVLCPVGTFQSQRRQSMCEECPVNKNTSTEGSVDSSACSIFCTAGKEGDDNDNCVPCAPDFHKETASFGGCDPCVGDFTSGSSRISCTEVFCDIGRTFNGTHCTDCAVGFYKGFRGNDACEECPANTTTSSTGETDISDCNEVFCVPGYFSPDNETCEACAIGYYKDHPGNDECTPCSENTTTEARASTEEGACYLKICPPGEYRNDDNNCLLCGIGFYQPMSGSTDCESCDGGYTTEEEGSTQEEDCLIECPAGEYRNVSLNECEACAIGYFQETPNSETCLECPGNFTTLTEGTRRQQDCQIQCPPGYVISSSTQCTPCGRGLFQEEPNNVECVPCERIDVYDVSTLDIASTSSESCLPLCPPGLYLNITSKSCIECAIGSFKTTSGLDTECEPCPHGNTTLERGSINMFSCIYELCDAGFFREEGEPDCQKCPIGQYQPNSGVMLTSCFDCPIGKTTLITGAEDEDRDCITDCDDGQEYRVATGNCHACGIGFYKKKPDVLVCTLCPDGQTTLGVNSSQCVDTDTEPRAVQIVIYKFNVTFSLNDCGNEVHFLNFIPTLIRAIAQLSALRYSGICQNNACDNIVVFIPFYCGTTRQREDGIVKRSTGGTVIAEVTANNVPDLVEDTDNSDVKVSTASVLEQLFIDLSPDVEETMAQNEITFVRVDPASLACSPGSVLSDQSGNCELCPAGQYHLQVSDVCSPCPKGSYSVESRLTCQSCPDGESTEMEGSQDESSCDGECAFDDTFCGDHGQCEKNADDVSYCECNEFYTGENCQSSLPQEVDEGDDSDIIIGVCAGIGGLFILILLIVFICSRALSSKRSVKKKKSISSDGESGNDFVMPVYFAPPVSRSQQNNFLTFDPTMYQSDVVDIYQSQATSRDQASI